MSECLICDALAGGDAKQQAAFLNEFYRVLKVVCKGRHEMQVAYIADYLDGNGREFVTSLAEFAKHAVESRAQLEAEISQLYRQKHEVEKEIGQLREQRETVAELVKRDAEAPF